MELEVKRIDHLGIVAGVIKELGLIEALDERLQKDTGDQEEITPGEAVAGMIMNGLGFSDRPLTLTPQFFESKALEKLFRADVKAAHFNRHKLGKTLDFIHEYGCEKLFYELSQHSCSKENLDLQFNSEDTTSFSVTGEYAADVDEHTIQIRHGYSKDHRPDLKQIVHELLVSQDGGVPLMMKSWDGNASDNKIFKERCEELITHFEKSDSPRYLIADSKLYAQSNAENLSRLPYITRIPGTLKEASQIISRALNNKMWKSLNEYNRYYEESITHYNISQRWIVVYSEKAKARAEKSLNRACENDKKKIEKALWHLSNQAYGCKDDAEKALKKIAKNSRYYKIQSPVFTEKNIYDKKGRPKKGIKPASHQYFINANVVLDEEAVKNRLDEKSCFVIGTNINKEALPTNTVINAYKDQNPSIENTGFRFLKDPLFFVSSLYLKKPSRIMGLLAVMTLALLVYSIAQRRLRKALEEHGETLPNQINAPTSAPTLRWIFQMMDGINFVKVKMGKLVNNLIEGMTDIKKKIICCFGECVMQIYDISENIFLGAAGGSM